MKVVQLNIDYLNFLDKLRAGDRKAQNAVYNQYAPMVLSVVRQYLNDTSDAESVMVDAFFKAFTQIERLEEDIKFLGWLKRIAINKAIDFNRRHKTKSATQVELETYSIIDDESTLEKYTSDDTEIIQSIIDKLPYGYREVFLLKVVEGMKHQEIAELLDISENTSKSQLTKAKFFIQNQLNQISKKNIL